MNYTGTITLNFATAPQYIDKEKVHEYYRSDVSSSITFNCNNGTQTTYALFPVKLILKS